MNISKNHLPYLVLFVFMIFSLPVFSSAQTNVNDAVQETAQKIIEDKFNSETGLDKVKDFGSIDAGKIADRAVKYAHGEVPSQIMGSLIDQMRDVKNTGLQNNFRPYTKKTHNANAPYRTKNACQRIANQRHLEGLDAANVKARLTPWVDIAWTAVKSIASGGKSLGDLVAENTKANAEKMIKEALFGKAEPKVETVTIPHYDSCNSKTKITWDPINMRVIAVTTGNCGCKLYEGDGKDTLKDFTVTLVAPVEVTNVKIEEENYFIFWKKYNIKAQYKVGKLKVVTDANCNCNKDISLPPPPKNESIVEENGFFGGMWDWFFEPKDKVNPAKDKTLSPKDKHAKDKDTKGKNISKEISGIPAFIDWLFGRDKKDGEMGVKDSIKNPTGEEEKGKIEEKPLVCGEVVSVDGRDNVPTFVFRESSSQNVNFYCNNSCSPEQVCKVLPESVGAYHDSCVYCANKKEYIPEPKKEDIISTKCEIPSQQGWANGMMPGFEAIVLDKERVLIKNSNTYCGMKSLAVFKSNAEATMRLFGRYCSNIKLDDYKYTDIRGSCSFIAYFNS